MGNRHLKHLKILLLALTVIAAYSIFTINPCQATTLTYTLDNITVYVYDKEEGTVQKQLYSGSLAWSIYGEYEGRKVEIYRIEVGLTPIDSFSVEVDEKGATMLYDVSLARIDVDLIKVADDIYVATLYIIAYPPGTEPVVSNSGILLGVTSCNEETRYIHPTSGFIEYPSHIIALISPAEHGNLHANLHTMTENEKSAYSKTCDRSMSSTQAIEELIVEEYNRCGKYPYTIAILFSFDEEDYAPSHASTHSYNVIVFYKLSGVTEDSVSVSSINPRDGTTLMAGSDVTFSCTADYKLVSADQAYVVMDFEIEYYNETSQQYEYAWYYRDRYADDKLVSRGLGTVDLSDTITVPSDVQGFKATKVRVYVFLLSYDGKNALTNTQIFEYPIEHSEVQMEVILSSDSVLANGEDEIDITVRLQDPYGYPAKGSVGIAITTGEYYTWLTTGSLVKDGKDYGAIATFDVDSSGKLHLKFKAPNIVSSEYVAQYWKSDNPFPVEYTLTFSCGNAFEKKTIRIEKPPMLFIEAVKLAKDSNNLLTRVEPVPHADITITKYIMTSGSKTTIKDKTSPNGRYVIALTNAQYSVKLSSPGITRGPLTLRVVNNQIIYGASRLDYFYALFIMSSDDEYLQSLRDRVKAFLQSWVSSSDLNRIVNVKLQISPNVQKPHHDPYTETIYIPERDLKIAFRGDYRAFMDLERTLFHEWGHHVNLVLRGSNIPSYVESPVMPAEDRVEVHRVRIKDYYYEGEYIVSAEKIAFEEGSADLFAHLVLLKYNIFNIPSGFNPIYTQELDGINNAVKEAIASYMTYGDLFSGTAVVFVQDYYGHDTVKQNPEWIYEDFVKTLRSCGGMTISDFALEKILQAKKLGRSDIVNKVESLARVYTLKFTVSDATLLHLIGIHYRGGSKIDVKLVRSGPQGTAQYMLTPGTVLKKGDIITAPKDVKLIITYKKVVQISPSGDYTYKRGLLVIDFTKNGGIFKIGDFYEIIDVAVYGKDVPIHVGTSSSQHFWIKPISTEYLIEASDNTLIIKALKGSIEIYGSNDEVLASVNEGYEVTVENGVYVSQPTPIDYDALDQWWIEAQENAEGLVYTGEEVTSPSTLTITLIGYVTDDYGNPIAGALIEVGGYTAVTDHRGYYELNMQVSPGTYEVSASATGYQSKSKTMIFEASQTYELDFMLTPIQQGGGSQTQYQGQILIQGYVTDYDGNPIANAEISANEYKAYTDSSGFYELTIYTTSSYGTIDVTIQVSAPGYKTFTKTYQLEVGGLYKGDFKLEKEGCLIATAAFESELTWPVNFLRGFRDNYVLETKAGRAFMDVFNRFYYSWSPSVAEAERHSPELRATIRVALYPLIGSLMVSSYAYHALSLNPELAVLVAGVTTSFFIGLLYSLPIMSALIPMRLKTKRLKLWSIKPFLAALAISLGYFAMAEITGILLMLQSSSVLVVLTSIALGVFASHFITTKITRHFIKRN